MKNVFVRNNVGLYLRAEREHFQRFLYVRRVKTWYYMKHVELTCVDITSRQNGTPASAAQPAVTRKDLSKEKMRVVS